MSPGTRSSKSYEAKSFEIAQRLGSGSFASVHASTVTLPNGRRVSRAAKVLTSSGDPGDLEEAEREIRALQTLCVSWSLDPSISEPFCCVSHHPRHLAQARLRSGDQPSGDCPHGMYSLQAATGERRESSRGARHGARISPRSSEWSVRRRQLLRRTHSPAYSVDVPCRRTLSSSPWARFRRR